MLNFAGLFGYYQTYVRTRKGTHVVAGGSGH